MARMEILKRLSQTFDIGGRKYCANVEIAGDVGRAVQDSGVASDHHEIDARFS